jgi:hypothetical protein
MPAEDDLEVVVLGLGAGRAMRFEHANDVAPMDVVGRGVREELLEGLDVAVGHGGLLLVEAFDAERL